MKNTIIAVPQSKFIIIQLMGFLSRFRKTDPVQAGVELAGRFAASDLGSNWNYQAKDPALDLEAGGEADGRSAFMK